MPIYDAWKKELEDKIHQAIRDRHPHIIDVPRLGWYRRANGDIVYCWGTDMPLEPIKEKFEGYDDTDDGFMVFVPSPQYQPGVPQDNDWLLPESDWVWFL